MGILETGFLIIALFAILGLGVWIGLALLGVGWLAVELFTDRPILGVIALL